MKRAVLFVVFALLVLAAKPQPLKIETAGEQRHSVVEQQSPGGALCVDDCVVNPTDFCPWDPDESVHARGYGLLEAGRSVSWSGCVIADWATHMVYVDASGGRNSNLAVTVEIDNPHRSKTVTAHGSLVRFCVIAPEYVDGSAKLPLVVGSNGGVGQYTQIRVTVTNLGRKAKVTAQTGIQYAQLVSSRTTWCGDTLTCEGWTSFALEPQVCWGIAEGG